MFLFLICSKHFLYLPTYSAPQNIDPSKRNFCKGWWCDFSKEENPNAILLKNLLLGFKNGTISSIHKNISSLIARGYTPAYCVSGFFYLLGLSDYQQNLTKSQLLLKQGSENCFACSEVLAFHPLTEHKKYHLKKAKEQGSLLAKYLLIKKELQKEKPDYGKILPDVHHLALISSLSWMTKHRSGMRFANTVKQLTTEPKRKTSHWQKMFKLAESGHPVAALWVLEGVISNRTHQFSSHQAVNLIKPHIFNGPWKSHHTEIPFLPNNFNKTTALKFFGESDDDAAEALLSFPQLYK